MRLTASTNEIGAHVVPTDEMGASGFGSARGPTALERGVKSVFSGAREGGRRIAVRKITMIAQNLKYHIYKV